MEQQLTLGGILEELWCQVCFREALASLPGGLWLRVEQQTCLRIGCEQQHHRSWWPCMLGRCLVRLLRRPGGELVVDWRTKSTWPTCTRASVVRNTALRLATCTDGMCTAKPP